MTVLGAKMLSQIAMRRLAALGIFAVAIGFGCEPAKSVIPIVKINPAAVAEKAMQLYDTNKDGKIAGAELDKAPCFSAALDTLGTDATKGVTADQITARVQKWNDDKNGLEPVLCNVAHNGKPVAGAEVKFVPDPCISDYLTQSGVGKTDATGATRIGLPKEPGSDMPTAIPPGFYRVEITKSGESIPAQYNTATTFGQEISHDGSLKHALAGKRMLFDMKY
jgi:hypothetical protein